MANELSSSQIVESENEDENDNEEILKKLESYFHEADSYRKNFEPEWEEYERYYHGQHWKGEQRPLKNWCFSIVEGEVPILTDSRPSPDIISHDGSEEGQEKAKMLSAGMDYVAENQNEEIKIAQAERAALITGTSFIYTDYDPDLEKGEGAVTERNLNWRNVWLDPASSEMDEGNYWHLKFPIRISEIARRFKKNPDEIKRVSAAFLSSSTSANEGRDETRWSPDSKGSNPNRYTGEDITVLDEWWLKDYTQIDIPEEETLSEITKEAEELINGINPDVGKYENHQEHMEAHEELKLISAAQLLGAPVESITPEIIETLKADSEEFNLICLIIDDHQKMHQSLMELNPEGKKPKYENNLRLILKIDKDILYDGSPPVEDEGIVPLTPIYCYKEENSIYGFGEIKNILPVQKSYNEMDHAEYVGLKKNSNSGWIKDDNSNVADTSLTNKEGIVITKRAGTEVKRIEPGEVSPQLQLRKQNDQQCIEILSGVNEATQGRRPTGVTAASAIKYLQEQSIGRIRLKTRFLEGYSILRLGYLKCNRILKYWSIEKKLRTFDKMTGKLRYTSYSPEAMKNFRYDLKIVPGSTAGIDKESIFTLYSDLFAKDMIDAVTYFMIVDIPYKNLVLERLEEQNQMKMQLEQLMMENESLKMQLGGATTSLQIENQNAGIPQDQLAIA